MIAARARAPFTLDTNILVCSVDRPQGERHELALKIVDRAPETDCRLTLQAISEFYSAVTRKRILLAPRAAALAEAWLAVFPCVIGSATAVRSALSAAIAGRAPYWDALLVATAAESGCGMILTEDMADGTTLSGVAIHNPFAPTGGLTEQARVLLDF